MTENICCVCGREYELKNGGWYCPRCMAKRFSADECLTVRVTDEPTETVEESVTEAKPTDKDKVESVKIIEDIFVENELRIAEINLKAGAFEMARRYYERILEKGENASALRGLIYTLLETKGEDSHAAALNIHKLRSLELVSRLVQIDEENVLDVAWLIGVVGKSLEMRVDPEGMSCSYIKSTEKLSDDTVERSTTPGGTAKSALALAIKLMNLVEERKHYLLADSLFKVAHNAKLLGCFDEAQVIFEHLCTLCESSWELRIAELEARRRVRNTDELLRTKGDIGTDSALMRAMELVPSSNNISLEFLARLSVEQDDMAKRMKAEKNATAKKKIEDKKKKIEDKAVTAKNGIVKAAVRTKKLVTAICPILPCAVLFLLSFLIPSVGFELLGCAAGILPISVFLYLHFTVHKTEKKPIKLSVILYIGFVVLLTSLLMLCIASSLGALLASIICTVGLFFAKMLFKSYISGSNSMELLYSFEITAGLVLFGVSLGSYIGFESVFGGLCAGIVISLGIVFTTVFCILNFKNFECVWARVVVQLLYGFGVIALFVLCFISRSLAFMALPSLVTIFASYLFWMIFDHEMACNKNSFIASNRWWTTNLVTFLVSSVFVIIVLCWSFGVWRVSSINADNEGYRVNMTYSEEVIVIPEGVTHLERVRAPRAEKIVLPSTLVYIDDGCFRNCGVVKIDIPDGVTYIGANAFRKCTALTEIALPKSLKTIGRCAFLKCRLLSSVEIPEGVTVLREYTFKKCRSLTTVILNEGLEKINIGCFNKCSLLNEIYLPDSLKNIDACFYYCSQLRNISIGKNIKHLPANMFNGAVIDLLHVTFRGFEEEWKDSSKSGFWYGSASEIELTFTEQ